MKKNKVDIKINGTIRPVVNIHGIIDNKNYELLVYNGKKLIFSSKEKNNTIFELEKKDNQYRFSIVTPIFFITRDIKVYIKKDGDLELLDNYKENFAVTLLDRVFKSRNRTYRKMKQNNYLKWIKMNEYSDKEEKPKTNPVISIVMACDNEQHLNRIDECLNAVTNQTYQNYELNVICNTMISSKTVEILEKWKQENKKIKVAFLKDNKSTGKMYNDVIESCNGEFVILLQPYCELSDNALNEFVKTLDEDKNIDFIYGDHDNKNKKNIRIKPKFKPDWSPDYIINTNYIGNLFMVRKKLIQKIKGFQEDYTQDLIYDFILRITEKTSSIKHISKILSHNYLSIKNNNDETQNTVLEAMKRRKMNVHVKSIDSKSCVVDYDLDKEPLVSIIIPTRDYADVLSKCLKSIYSKTTYKNYEVIVVDNNSKKDSTLKLFEEYKKNYDNFSTIKLDCAFNYSYLNNEAVKKSKGEYIILLNNDTEIITKDWIHILVGYGKQNHIGCVGAKLVYPDNTVQHGGVYLGGGDGIAGHAFLNYPKNDKGYMNRLCIPSNYAAVTAACLLIKKDKYNEIEGLDEKLQVAYNDLDLNLKLLEKGYYNVLLPQVELYHHESKSRGYDDTKEKQKRYISECNYMKEKWGKILEFDKFYNINLSKKYSYEIDVEI